MERGRGDVGKVPWNSRCGGYRKLNEGFSNGSASPILQPVADPKVLNTLMFLDLFPLRGMFNAYSK